MHRVDVKHVSRIGNIITKPGVVLSLTQNNDVVGFGERGELSVALLTANDKDVFVKPLIRKKHMVESFLAIYGVNPQTFIQELNNEINSSEAIKESVFKGFYLDAGLSGLFNLNFINYTTNLDSHCNGNNTSFNSPFFNLREISSPALEIFDDTFIIKQIPAILMSISKTKYENRNREVVQQRRQIVSNVISVLSAISAQILHLTNGKMTYVPDGHCINIAMLKTNTNSHPNQSCSKSQSQGIFMVINDPIGSGWKILDDGVINIDQSDTISSWIEKLVEFSAKCVVYAITKRGVQINDIQNIVNSIQFKGNVTSLGNCPGVSVFTSGSCTTKGIGSVTVLTADGERHTQVELSEFRVDTLTSYYNNFCSDTYFQIEPRVKNGGERLSSPSILQWFPAFSATIIENKIEKNRGLTFNESDVWQHIPVMPFCIPKGRRLFKIKNMTTPNKFIIKSPSVSIAETIKKNPISLCRFDWKQIDYEDKEKYQTENLHAKISAMIALMAHRKFQDLYYQNQQKCHQQNQQQHHQQQSPLPCSPPTMSVASLITSVYGFKVKPLIKIYKKTIKKNNSSKEKVTAMGDGSLYVISIIGNSPDGSDIYAIRIEKQVNYSMTAQEHLKCLGANKKNASCKWTKVAPTMIKGYYHNKHCTLSPYNNTYLSPNLLMYTPMCVHHTETSYVHLYREDRGFHTENIVFNYTKKYLQIKYNKEINIKDKQIINTICTPLIVAALASEQTINVNGRVTAIPIHQGYGKDEKKTYWKNTILSHQAPAAEISNLLACNQIRYVKISLDRNTCEEKDNNNNKQSDKETLFSPSSLTTSIQHTCQQSYFKCPSESIVFQCGSNFDLEKKKYKKNSSKNETKSYNSETGYISLAL
uniref:Wsv442-like protein n=1 Tax=Pasiphaea japonica whispovirus TaxID=2984286 RepID=A0A9C7F8M9_9VIRU|nr:MAG: wsv442-like protein [Pasiphaea japonica whispovirus]